MNLSDIKIIGTPPLDKEQIDNLENQGVEIYDNSNEILSTEKIINIIGDAHTVAIGISTHINKEVAFKCKKLRKVISYTSGLDHIDVEACKANDIDVINIKGYCATAIAEKTIGLIILALNKLIFAINDTKAGNWNGQDFQGRELSGKSVCVIGNGAIGREVVKLLNGFGVNISQINSKTSIENKKLYLSKSDIISLNIPFNINTENIIDYSVLSLLKPNVILVNTSRGGLINEDALYSFLKINKDAVAVLDVLKQEPPQQNPLLSLDNVIVTPHLGWNSKEAIEKMKNWLFYEICSSADV